MSFDIGARHDALRIAELPNVIHEIMIAYAGNEVVPQYTIHVKPNMVASIEPLVTYLKGLLYIDNRPKPLRGINYISSAYRICDTQYVFQQLTSIWIYDIASQTGYVLKDAEKVIVFQQSVYYLSQRGVCYKHLSRDNDMEMMDRVWEIYKRGDYLLLKHDSNISHLWDGEAMHIVPRDTYSLHRYHQYSVRISETRIQTDGLDMVFPSKPKFAHQKEHLVFIQTKDNQYVWDFKRKQLYNVDPLPRIHECNNVTHHIESTQIVVYQ